MSVMGVRRRGRRRGLLVGAAVGTAVGASAARRSNSAPAEDTAADPGAVSDTSQQMDELAKLGQLKDQGILTQEEFDAKKKQILGL